MKSSELMNNPSQALPEQLVNETEGTEEEKKWEYEESMKRLEELKAGRDIGDIPLHDEYFKAVNKSRKYFPNT